MNALLAHAGVLDPLFEAMRWRADLRLVSRAWRRVYDARVPYSGRPLSRWLSVDNLERAVSARVDAWCALRVHTDCGADVPDGFARLAACAQHMHTLKLKYCHPITDLLALAGPTSFGSLHTLELKSCRDVGDMASLGSLHTLTLDTCRDVVDVSKLGSVHTLTLTSCHGVTSVAALGSDRSSRSPPSPPAPPAAASRG